MKRFFSLYRNESFYGSLLLTFTADIADLTRYDVIQEP